MADEGADGLFMRTDRFTRLRDGGVSGEIAGIDAALEVGERDHESTSCDDEAGYGEPRHRASVTPSTIKQVDHNLRLGKGCIRMHDRTIQHDLTFPTPNGSTACG